MPAQIRREHLLEVPARGVLLDAFETGLPPRVLVALDDPRAQGLLPALERVGVDGEQPVLAFVEDERERAERQRRAEPHELALAPADVGLEVGFVLLPQEAVHAVGGEDQVRVADGRVVRHVALEAEVDVELAAARVEDLQQALPRQTAEAVAGGERLRAADRRLDVAPVGEALRDLRVRLGIGLLEAAERLVGEHDAPAERVVGLVAFVDDDLRLRKGLPHQDGEIEPGRPAADARDLHATAG
jgi:hypothetical protein